MLNPVPEDLSKIEARIQKQCPTRQHIVIPKQARKGEEPKTFQRKCVRCPSIFFVDARHYLAKYCSQKCRSAASDERLANVRSSS